MRVIHWYPNFYGGGGVANAVKGLSATQSALGLEVMVAAASSDGAPLYEQMTLNERVRPMAWNPHWTMRGFGLTLRGLPRSAVIAMREFNPDSVHIHGEFNPDNFWVPRFLGCPLVLSPHGAFHPVVFSKSRRLAKRFYFGMANRLLYRQIDAFHALSPAEADHIRRVLPEAMVYVAPHGSNLLPGDSASETQTTANTGELLSLVFVGRLDVYTKGLDILIDALNAARQQMTKPQLALTLVGPDWRGSMQWLRQRAVELGIDDRISFTGPLTAEEVSRVLSEADIYIQLSRHESFGLSVAEALLAGKPAILSRNIGVVSYTDIGMLPHVRIVDPNAGDAATALMDVVHRFPDLRQCASQYKHNVRRFFSWESAARLHIEHYENIRR